MVIVNHYILNFCGFFFFFFHNCFGGFLKHSGLIPQFDSVGMTLILRICISNKFLDDPENHFQITVKERQPFKMDSDDRACRFALRKFKFLNVIAFLYDVGR